MHQASSAHVGSPPGDVSCRTADGASLSPIAPRGYWKLEPSRLYRVIHADVGEDPAERSLNASWPHQNMTIDNFDLVGFP